MAVPGRQLELLPFHIETVEQRRELIRRRLIGLKFRQAARDARRDERNERRRARKEGRLSEPRVRQMTIEDVIAKSRSANLNKPVTTLPLFPDIFDE
jgi:polynucleotide 5'-kinase involved in rRNA processing